MTKKKIAAPLTREESIAKIKRSALVALGGIGLLDLPILTKELVDFISNGDPFDWKTPSIVFITGFSTWLVNTIKVWVQSQDKT